MNDLELKLKAATLDSHVVTLSTGTYFKVYHNLRSLGYNIEDFLTPWIEEETKYQAKFFCKYISEILRDDRLIMCTEKQMNTFLYRNHYELYQE